MERKDTSTPAERAFHEYAEGIDRALAPLRVVGRLGFLPQGAENCVDVFEVIDVINHFLDDAEALRHQLDVALEIAPPPQPHEKGPESRRGSSSSSSSSNASSNGAGDSPKPSDARAEKPKGENKAKPE